MREREGSKRKERVREASRCFQEGESATLLLPLLSLRVGLLVAMVVLFPSFWPARLSLQRSDIFLLLLTSIRGELFSQMQLSTRVFEEKREVNNFLDKFINVQYFLCL